MQKVLPDTAETKAGRLFIGGCDAVELAERYGTPLIVFDRATFENNARSFSSRLPPERVTYAGKAFMCIAVCQLVHRLGLALDVCTGGELATAVAADFPGSRITFHGNNKSEEELAAARDAGVGRVVVDSFDEMARIEEVGLKTKLLIRVTPGVEAHTHEFVQTGQEDSKFGFSLGNDVAATALKQAEQIRGCELVGVHAHIGSQIFELAAFELAVERIADFLLDAKERFGFEAQELNLGGGLGIAHTRDEMTPDPTDAVARLLGMVEKHFAARNLAVPALGIEPGRSIVGPAAVTLYRIGTKKTIPGVRTYLSVDGGMSDNIRPPLYGARYEAFLANRTDERAGGRVSIAGKHCESGDILIKDVHLPDDVRPGDVLCIPATGAYTYSMASNYNRIPRPPVVMVEDGGAIEIVRRETYRDLVRLDRSLDETT
ncbi:MAG: diaminopimelate decarboxylase [Actinomycetota bacterium]|nr:diaminopimelate decarboxylase [Actinomycetota bacterium]